MANTTFNGPVRSENNYQVVSKNATTGLVQNRTLHGGLKDTRRYYLEEWFNQLPKLNAYLLLRKRKIGVVFLMAMKPQKN